MTTGSAQDFIFQRIREMLPTDISLADTVSEILHVSTDSAYRRIRGETPLVLEEAMQICHHFHLSLDQLLHMQNGYTVFKTEGVYPQQLSFEKYLEGILHQLHLLNNFEKKEIIYLSKDLPFFHNFLYEPLFAFHYFFWMRSIFRDPGFEDRNFTMDCIPASIKEKGKEIIKAYYAIPSTEIWNTECVNSTIFQVEYYREAGFFSSSNDIKAVYEAVSATLSHLKDQAENGSKHFPGDHPEIKKNNFKFFYNRATLGDNTILTIHDKGKTAFINYDVINYMHTHDEKFCNEVYDNLRSLIKRSTLISETSEKQRNIFFGIMQNKINDRVKNI